MASGEITYFADSESFAYKEGYAGAQYYNTNPYEKGTSNYEDYNLGSDDFWIDWFKTGL